MKNITINTTKNNNLKYKKMDLQLIDDFIQESNSSNSNNDKLKVLENYTQYEIVRKVLNYTYNTFKQYHVTSKNCQKNKELSESGYTDLFTLLDDLDSRKITGYQAIKYVNGFIKINEPYKDIIYNILDRNLKTRSTASMINKAYSGLIPTFDVALANPYNDKTAKKVDWQNGWYISRKLDGIRCLIVIDENGDVKITSRAGKPFTTLGKLEADIKKLNLTSTVLDGEVCIVGEDGNENFQDIVKEIKRKDHTIENPLYYIFDMLTMEEFISKTSTRTLHQRLVVCALNTMDSDSPNFTLLPQYLGNRNMLTEMVKTARDGGWEGLMLRKNTTYKGKRSNDILKVKAFKDDEYTILDTESSTNRVIVDGHEVDELMLKNIIIEHKGNRVQVGSGFSHEERRLYYKEPKRIIGKQATIQYFEESKDINGNYSLRFPIIKAIYDGQREF